MSTTTLPEFIVVADTEHEPRYRILIHNDDITTFDFVLAILMRVFKLSREVAEHIALTAHFTGVALVAVRPKSEAEQLVKKATMAARLEGFPLAFTVEPEE